jgi:hypothetical protein
MYNQHIFTFIKAINWANFDAVHKFAFNTLIFDYVGHKKSSITAGFGKPRHECQDDSWSMYKDFASTADTRLLGDATISTCISLLK